jgi:hypothetical protein
VLNTNARSPRLNAALDVLPAEWSALVVAAPRRPREPSLPREGWFVLHAPEARTELDRYMAWHRAVKRHFA